MMFFSFIRLRVVVAEERSHERVLIDDKVPDDRFGEVLPGHDFYADSGAPIFR